MVALARKLGDLFNNPAFALRLFDGAQAAPAADAQGTQTAGARAETSGDSRRENAPGVTDGEAHPDGDSDAGNRERENPDRQSRWTALRHGEFKAEFDADVQKILKGRLREHGELEKRVQKVEPILQSLYAHYDVDSPEALLQSLEGDDSLLTHKAQKAGLTVEQYRERRRLETENRALRAQQEAAEREAQANRQVAAWEREAAEAARDYPELELGREAANEQFLALLRKGVGVKNAYELLHMDEIREKAAREAERQVVENVRARGQRPSENGVSGTSGFTVKNDVSRLSRAERAELARRAARGEKVTF